MLLPKWLSGDFFKETDAGNIQAEICGELQATFCCYESNNCWHWGCHQRQTKQNYKGFFLAIQFIKHVSLLKMRTVTETVY